MSREYVRFNSVQNAFVCVFMTLTATFLTTKDFSIVSLLLSFAQSYAINQAITFMINMDKLDAGFNSLTKIKNIGLSNAIINTVVYATIISALNTLLASTSNFFANWLSVYPILFIVGVVAGYLCAPISIALTSKK